MSIKLERGIRPKFERRSSTEPRPPRTGFVAALRKMKPGESFLYKATRPQAIHTMAKVAGFRVRVQAEGAEWRVWKKS